MVRDRRADERLRKTGETRENQASADFSQLGNNTLQRDWERGLERGILS